MKKTVCLYNGADLVRGGLKSLIQAQRDYVVVDDVVAAKPGKLKLVAQKHCPDISLIIVPPSGMRGLMTNVASIRKGHPTTHIVFVTAPDDTAIVSVALKVGAAACIPVYAKASVVLSILKKVARGEQMDLSEARKELKKSKGRRLSEAKGGKSAGLLTAREREVVHMLTSGSNTKEAASIMKISPKTIEVHRLNIMKKLKMRSMSQLTKLAIRSGLTTLDG